MTGNVRRGNLISPFGVGALSMLVNRTSVITAGLDHWFTPIDHGITVDRLEYRIEDTRLQARLDVHALYSPPDFRQRQRHGDPSHNIRLTIPALRFPTWAICRSCQRIRQFPATLIGKPACDNKDKHPDDKIVHRLIQVTIFAICADGHLTDFPWSEWVHRTNTPRCSGPLQLRSAGGGTLAGQSVVCEACKATRPLESITQASRDGSTTLSKRLTDGDDDYLCTGDQPWLGLTGTGCGGQLRGALRSASNVYFPKVESALFLPSATGVDANLIAILQRPACSGLLSAKRNTPTLPLALNLFRSADADLNGYDDLQLQAAVDEMVNPATATSAAEEDLTDEVAWRRPEHEHLRHTQSQDSLQVTDAGVAEPLRSYLDRVHRVDALVETRALRGFTRVRDKPLPLTEGKALLRRGHPNHWSPQDNWLPAYQARGEGIYLELDRERLTAWESRPAVRARIGRLASHHTQAQALRGAPSRAIIGRHVLVHTLAHLLINQLIFDCGYGSASLRERLYLDPDPAQPMAAMLIYTAASDSEGTMGGLVRMAQPERLHSVLERALRHATWCSNDPTCMEAGDHGGQGPDSCNLAACHACALLPETSCEQYNTLLDRAVVVGSPDDSTIGYLTDLLA